MCSFNEITWACSICLYILVDKEDQIESKWDLIPRSGSTEKSHSRWQCCSGKAEVCVLCLMCAFSPCWPLYFWKALLDQCHFWKGRIPAIGNLFQEQRFNSLCSPELNQYFMQTWVPMESLTVVKSKPQSLCRWIPLKPMSICQEKGLTVNKDSKTLSWVPSTGALTT